MGLIGFFRDWLERFGEFNQRHWVVGLVAAVSLMVFAYKAWQWTGEKTAPLRKRWRERPGKKPAAPKPGSQPLARLTFTRGRSWFRGIYGIQVGGQSRGSIYPGRSLTIEVPPGEQEVYVFYIWSEDSPEGLPGIDRYKQSNIDRRDLAAGRTYEYVIVDKLFKNIALEFRKSYITE